MSNVPQKNFSEKSDASGYYSVISSSVSAKRKKSKVPKHNEKWANRPVLQHSLCNTDLDEETLNQIALSSDVRKPQCQKAASVKASTHACSGKEKSKKHTKPCKKQDKIGCNPNSLEPTSVCEKRKKLRAKGKHKKKTLAKPYRTWNETSKSFQFSGRTSCIGPQRNNKQYELTNNFKARDANSAKSTTVSKRSTRVTWIDQAVPGKKLAKWYFY